MERETNKYDLLKIKRDTKDQLFMLKQPRQTYDELVKSLISNQNSLMNKQNMKERKSFFGRLNE